MDKISLKAALRTPGKERAKDILKAGKLPVELYGHGADNVSCTVDYQEFRKAFAKGGQSTIFEFDIDGKKYNVLVHDLAFDPIYDTFTHVDVKLVNMKETVDATVQLNFIGTAKAVKDLNGTLNKNLEEITVRCLPGDLLHHIDVDISVLEDFHNVIHISDLEITKSDKYEILHEMDESICTVSAPREEEEETPVDTLTMEVPTEKEEKASKESTEE